MTLATAIVLARGGSKGVPRKNVRDVAGRPCVWWTLRHALGSATVGRVVVSSDDPEVLEIAAAEGCLPHERPAELAHDTARVDDAARSALEAVPGDGPVVILYGNVPVRPADLTDRAVSLLAETGCDSVQSYARVGKHHPWWTCRLGEGGRVGPWEGEVLYHNVFRRQDLPPAHVPDGGVTALTREALCLRVPGVAPGPHAFLGLDRRGVETGEGDVVDIDDEVDLVVADRLLRKRATTESTGSTEGGNEWEVRGQRAATVATTVGESANRIRGKPGVVGGGAGPGLQDRELTGGVIAAAIEVHRALGPGLLEPVYEACLADELVARGLQVRRQVDVPVEYRGRRLPAGYRIDLLVEDRLVLEIKAIEQVSAVHEAQLLTYLRLSRRRLGLLLNFNVKQMRDGIVRRIL